MSGTFYYFKQILIVPWRHDGASSNIQFRSEMRIWLRFDVTERSEHSFESQKHSHTLLWHLYIILFTWLCLLELIPNIPLSTVRSPTHVNIYTCSWLFCRQFPHFNSTMNTSGMLSCSQVMLGSLILSSCGVLLGKRSACFCSAPCFLFEEAGLPLKTLHTPAGEDNEIGVCDWTPSLI